MKKFYLMFLVVGIIFINYSTHAENKKLILSNQTSSDNINSNTSQKATVSPNQNTVQDPLYQKWLALQKNNLKPGAKPMAGCCAALNKAKNIDLTKQKPLVAACCVPKTVKPTSSDLAASQKDNAVKVEN